MGAELKVKATDNDRLVVGTGADGKTVVEIRRTPQATELHTHSGVWRAALEAERTTAIRDPSGAAVAVIHSGHLGHREIELPSGENIKCRTNRTTGHGYVFGDLATAKAPFLMPQRYFTLKRSDALLARPDCDLLTAVATMLSQSEISMSIAVAATTQ